METEKNKASKKKKILITIIVLVLIAVIAVLAFIIYKLLHKEPEPRNASEGLAVEDEYDKAEDATFTTDMNMVWAFPSKGRTSTNARIKNSEDNQYDVYFEVYLEDPKKTDEENMLYSSPVLPVGKRLKQLKLDKTLPDGEYSATCTFHLLDDEDPDKEIGKVSFGVTLIFGVDVSGQE